VDGSGERLIPDQQGDVAMEHLHRYAIAGELAGGKQVLDVASGEGYGAHLLSGVAARVFGVEICAEAVAHARAKYLRENLEFLIGRCTALPIADRSIDLAVSFETLEHVEEQEQMLDEIQRVLRPDGLLILSTPDRDVYTSQHHRDNPFHVRELSLIELQSLLASRFRQQRIYRQRLVRGSLVIEELNDHSGRQSGEFRTLRGDFSATSSRCGLADAVYLIALASNVPIDSSACGYFESGTVADDLVKELAATRGRLLSSEHLLGAAQADVETLHRILASRFWRSTGALRTGGALGLKVVRRIARRLGLRRDPTKKSTSITRARGGEAGHRRIEVAPAATSGTPSSVQALELRCAELERQLASREQEAQEVIRSLKQQKIMLVQERDELSRQRLALFAQREAAEERLRELEARQACHA
jgi:SAM-dependent methyltransferase